MLTLPPTLPSLHPHSHASCLPRLFVVLPLSSVTSASCHATASHPAAPSFVHFLLHHRLSHAPLLLWCTCLSSAPLDPIVQLFVVLPLITPMQLHVQCQARDNEKNLIVVRLQKELIGKVTVMVIACIEHKPE